MIERLYIKEHFSFKECDLSFDNSLILFSGASGAGKSLLMDTILSLFGYREVNASVIEATIPRRLNLDEFGIQEDEPNIFKVIKSKSSRYFINSQSVSKRVMNDISKSFVNYLNTKDANEFENVNLLELLDAISIKDDLTHQEILKEYKESFKEYKKIKSELDLLINEERRVDELREFAKYEISKIDEVNPKIGEDEELLEVKKSLSKKEKLKEALERAYGIFDYESYVNEVFELIDHKSLEFDEFMNDLRAFLESQTEKLESLEEIDIESMLERIEKISSLKNRYGTIEDILEYRAKKAEELKRYENLTFEKSKLQKKYKELEQIVDVLCEKLTKSRQKSLKTLKQRVNYYLKMLYMPEVDFYINKIVPDEFGRDEVVVNLQKIELKKISSGEYNRLRLAFLAVKNEYMYSEGGVLILDEIDANLSGKESMSVAKVLEFLSKKYQIFAISHQPQLSSRANMHFLVSKNSDGSFVKLLNKEERIRELARMVSGEDINMEATEFAKSLLRG